MSNLENYMKQQAIFCEQNDSISKNLYSEYPPFGYRNLFIINTLIYYFLLYSFIVSFTTSSQLYFSQIKSAA